MTDLFDSADPEDDSEFLFYQAEGGQTRVQVRLLNETVWLSQRLLADLFEKDVRTINEHIQNIFEEGELDKEAVIRKFRIVQNEGNRQVGRDVGYWNLAYCPDTCSALLATLIQKTWKAMRTL